MAAANLEQWLLVLFYQGWVLNNVQHRHTQTGRYESNQNQAMGVILWCTRDTSSKAIRELPDFSTVDGRIKLSRAQPFLKIIEAKACPLHSGVIRAHTNRLKTEKIVDEQWGRCSLWGVPTWEYRSWTGNVPNIKLEDALSDHITLDRRGREHRSSVSGTC